MVISTIKRVAIYARKSRDDETNEGLNIQVEQLIEKANANGWKYKVYKEVASSQDDHRPEWLKLRKNLSDYDAILCKDADRLSRRVGFIEELQDLLQFHGIYIVYLDGSFYDPNLDDDRFKMDMKAFIGKMEYEQTKKRLRNGRERVAKTGNWNGGNPPMGYWWDKNTKTLVVDEREAEKVRYIFSLYEDKKNLLQVSDQLNLEGIQTSRGKEFHPVIVSRILKNEIYMGNIVYGKTKYSKYNLYKTGRQKPIKRPEPLIKSLGTHKPIIDVEQWERVNLILVQNTGVKKPIKKARYQLSGLLRCPKCGRLLTYIKDRDESVRVKTCQTATFIDGTKITCGNKSVGLEQVEAMFYEKLSEHIGEIYNHIEDIKRGILIPQTETKSRAEEITERMNALEERREATLDLIIDRLIDRDRGKERVRKIDEELNKLRHEHALLPTETPHNEDGEAVHKLTGVVTVLESLLMGRSQFPTDELNTILTGFIDRVEYSRFGSKHDASTPFDLKIFYK